LTRIHAYWASFRVTQQTLEKLQSDGVSNEVLKKIKGLEGEPIKGQDKFISLLKQEVGSEPLEQSLGKKQSVESLILEYARYEEEAKPVSLTAPPVYLERVAQWM
jgi:hypothetical protein